MWLHVFLEHIHLYSPERQQQQVKEAPDTQQQQKNKQKKTTLKAGELVNSVTTFIYNTYICHALVNKLVCIVYVNILRH